MEPKQLTLDLKMSDLVTTNIEIKPHLKQYLITLYGEEPIHLPHRHNYNRLLVRLINKMPKDHKQVPADKNTVCVILPKNEIKNITVYNYLSRESQLIFRKEIEKDFWYDAKKYIDTIIQSENINRKQATLMCMKCYNISESDLTFDAFYKYFYRNMMKRMSMLCVSIF